MSEGKQDVTAQPLVIVRRRRASTEEAHHGGVWKIAYADFMTAMMAFFLVMWLVNAADKKTIVQVAAYFNPVRLTEKTPSSKGVEDPSSGEHKKQRSKEAKNQDTDQDEVESQETALGQRSKSAALKESTDRNVEAASKAEGQAEKEEALFADPMGVLDKLAGQVQDAADANAANKALRDPFNPAHRASGPKTEPVKAESPTAEAAKIGKEKPRVTVAPIPADRNELSDAARQAEAAKLAADVQRALADMGNAIPNTEVKSTPEGLLISITDRADFGMFSVGSAEPRPELVVALAKIAQLLKMRPGKLVVRGHTDGRAYRTGNYDNWRLSAARAQMSYHMLVRGGIDVDRFVAIEGRADRDLNVPEDKGAAQNRRIEILIKAEKP
jgi:chemotaxis protein MotB